MKSLSLLSALTLCSLVLATDLPHRRHHRDLVERQRPNMNDTWSEPPVSSSSTSVISSASATSSAAISASTPPASSSSYRPPESSFITFSSSAPSSSTVDPIPSSSVAPSSSAESSVQSVVVSSASAVSSAQASPSAVVSTISVPTSASVVSTASLITPSTLTRTQSISVVTNTRTASASATVAAADAQEGSTSGGLSKTALIAIIVVASVVGIGAIGFTLFRKYKLRPSKRFEKRLNAIDFTPKGGAMDDDFFEKSHNRSASASSAERHRKALIEEEFDTVPVNHVPGIPEHDFTAGAAGAGAYGAYNSDPFAHAQAYDYSYGSAEHGYPPQPHGYDQYGNPLSPPGHAYGYDYPTQDGPGAGADQGYANLQRGNSTGSAHLHGRTSPTAVSPQQQAYHDDFPESGMYLGRPTGGADGPYAQAAQYRSY